MNSNKDNMQDSNSPEKIEKRAKRYALLTRIGEIVSDSLFVLVKWNFFFFITCLPVVTIGPAMSALSRCTNMLAKEDLVQYEAGRNYFRFFKQGFSKAVVPGLVFLVLNTVFMSGLVIYVKLMGENMMFIPLVSMSMFALAAVWALAMHLFPRLWEEDGSVTQQSWSQLIKPAAADVILNIKGTAVAVVVNAFVLLLTAAYFPATLPVVLTVTFSVPAMVAAFSHTKPDVLY